MGFEVVAHGRNVTTFPRHRLQTSRLPPRADADGPAEDAPTVLDTGEEPVTAPAEMDLAEAFADVPGLELAAARPDVDAIEPQVGTVVGANGNPEVAVTVHEHLGIRVPDAIFLGGSGHHLGARGGVARGVAGTRLLEDPFHRPAALA